MAIIAELFIGYEYMNTSRVNAFITQRTIVLRKTVKAHCKTLCDARDNKETDKSYSVEFHTFFGAVMALATLALPGTRGEMTDFGVLLTGPAARGSGDSFTKQRNQNTTK